MLRDEEFRVGGVLVIVASAIVVTELIAADVLEGEEAIRHGVFNTVSMMTTTGFASDDFNCCGRRSRRSCCSGR